MIFGLLSPKLINVKSKMFFFSPPYLLTGNYETEITAPLEVLRWYIIILFCLSQILAKYNGL